MMLEWSLGRADLAARVENAVERVISDGAATQDLGGSATTDEVAKAVVVKAMTPQNEPALIEEVLPSNLPNALRACLTDSMAEMAKKAMLDDTASMVVWDSQRSFARVSAIACPTLVLQSTRHTKTEPIRRQSIKKTRVHSGLMHGTRTQTLNPAALLIPAIIWRRNARRRLLMQSVTLSRPYRLRADPRHQICRARFALSVRSGGLAGSVRPPTHRWPR